MIYLAATDSAVVVHPWPKYLERELVLERRLTSQTPKVNNDGVFKVVRRVSTQQEDMWYEKDGTGYVPPGLLEFTYSLLAQAGEEVQYIDYRTPCPPPDWSRLSVELREGQPEILQAMCTHRNALIKAATGLGKTETIVQFRRINPGARIAVVTFRGDVRNSIFNRLVEGDKTQSACLVRAGSAMFEADTYVLVDKSLHRIDPDMIDILIIDEVHGAGSEDSFDRLRQFTAKRVYGLSATPFGRHDKADMAASMLCGPVRVDLSYQFSVDTGANVPLYVYLYDAQGPDDLVGKSDHLREKLGIWRNTKRNTLAAHLCNQIPQSDQTLIVCRSLEHVLRLKRLLPDYTCVFREPEPERAEQLIMMQLLPRGWKGRPEYRIDEGAREDFEKANLTKVIATPVWREGVDFRHLRWLVRMDGTTNEITCIQIGGRLARRTETKGAAVLIDFNDKFSDFNRRSVSREKRYREEGWHVQHITAGPGVAAGPQT